MPHPSHAILFHFLSSGLVGLSGLALIYLISSSTSRTAHGGSTDWISSRQFLLLLLLAVWTAIFVDVAEHGHLPRIGEGIAGLTRWLL